MDVEMRRRAAILVRAGKKGDSFANWVIYCGLRREKKLQGMTTWKWDQFQQLGTCVASKAAVADRVAETPAVDLPSLERNCVKETTWSS
jgi:hypothetical protein